MRRSKSAAFSLDCGPLVVTNLERVLSRIQTKENAMNRLKSFALALTLIVVPLAQMAQGQTQTSDGDDDAKVKSEIAKRVAHKKTRVKIKLRDGGEVKGNIDQANDTGFTLTEDKTGKRLDLSYNSVEKVSGRGMSTLTKVGIAVGVGVIVVGIFVAVAIKNFDPFKGGITAR